MIVSQKITAALTTIGVFAPGETVQPQDLATGLLWYQMLLNSWKAQRLNLVRQLRTVFTWPLNTTDVIVGLGQTVSITTPAYLNKVTYIVPGTNPGVEVPMGLLSQEAYAALSIKQLPNALGLQVFYQQNLNDGFGTLTIWPEVTQNLQVVLYTPQGIDEPATTNDVVTGPIGFDLASTMQLARLLSIPYQKPWTPELTTVATAALQAFQSQHVNVGVLGVDAALVPNLGAGYNVLSDVMTTSNSR